MAFNNAMYVNIVKYHNFRRSCAHIVASKLNNPICHSNECQIGSFSFEATTFLYTLWYTVGFWLVQMTISTNPKPMIYRNLYENTDPAEVEFFEVVWIWFWHSVKTFVLRNQGINSHVSRHKKYDIIKSLIKDCRNLF